MPSYSVIPISKIALISNDDDLGIVPKGELIPLGDKSVKLSPSDKSKLEANLEPMTASPGSKLLIFPAIIFF